MSSCLWSWLGLLITWMTCSRRSRWDMLRVCILDWTLTVPSNGLYVFCWIFSSKFLCVTQEVSECIFLSSSWILHTNILGMLLMCRWSWLPSILSLRILNSMWTLSNWNCLLSHGCCTLTLRLIYTWSLIWYE